MRDLIVLIIAPSDQCSRDMLPFQRPEQICVAHTRDEATAVLSRINIDAAVVDLECASLDDVAGLIKEWSLDVVCVHRVADESLWLKVLNVGALDCCYPNQAWHAVQSVRKRNRQLSVSAAA